MAQLPFEDVKQIYDRTHPKNWHEFEKALEHYRANAKAPHVEDGWMDLVLDVARTSEKVGRPFPDTVQQVYDELSQAITGIETPNTSWQNRSSRA